VSERERVVAIMGAGTDQDRAIAVACAEAGARIALGTLDRSQQQEYAVNSIANEIWSIGPEQFATVLDATDAADVEAFAAQVWDRFGACDLLVANHDTFTEAPLDELSPDEWEATIRANLNAPFFAAHAFGRRLTEQGGGRVLLIAHERPGGDAAYAAAKAGLEGLARAMTEGWSHMGVFVEALAGVQDPDGLARTAVERLARTR